MSCSVFKVQYGAGEGNRTLDNSLEGCGFTTKLHPHRFPSREDRIRTCDPLVPNQVLYQAELLPVNYEIHNFYILSYLVIVVNTFMRSRGLEPPRDKSHQALNLTRLPFRHDRVIRYGMVITFFCEMVSRRGFEPLTL